MTSILLIGLAAAAVGWLFYARMDTLLARRDAVDDLAFRDKMAYLYGKGQKASVLMIGSSRVFHQLDPSVVDSVSGLYSYNLGMDAVNLGEMRMMVRVMGAQGRMPAVLVMNIDPSSFMVTRPVFNFTSLLAYAAADTVVYHSMASIQQEYRWKWKYPFYRFQRLSGQADALKLSVMIGRERIADGFGSYARGYLPYPSGYHETLVKPFKEECQAEGFALLREVAAVCRRSGVRLILVTAPMYKDYKRIFLNADDILSRVSKLAVDEHIPYYNMIGDPLSQQRENFFNFVHLTGAAARVYSVRVGEIVKTYH